MQRRDKLYLYLTEESNPRCYLGMVFDKNIGPYPQYITKERAPHKLLEYEPDICIIENNPLWRMIWANFDIGDCIDVPELHICMGELLDEVEDWYR